MAELDRKLGLKRGTANEMRKRGVIDAEQIGGRLWGVQEKDIAKIRRAIEDYRSNLHEYADYVTVRVAAMRLKLAESTIYNLVRLGRLKTEQAPNRRLYITVQSLEEYRTHRLPPGVGIKLGRRARRIA